MKKRSKVLLIGASVLALGGGATAAAIGNGGGGDDAGETGQENDATEQVSGSGADQARAAALKYVHGTVNSVEAESEHGATWGVEVTKSNGNTVDVFLDQNYKLIVVESDEGG